MDDVSYTKNQKLMQYSLYFKAVNTAFPFSVLSAVSFKVLCVS